MEKQLQINTIKEEKISETSTLFTIREAADFASKYINKNVTVSNITYLLNYGRVPKVDNNGLTLISKQELIKYYENFYGRRELDWKKKLGDDLNWSLSFEHLKEAETTKHVHRLHPYKGKYIPQLVEYFLDGHTDEFKKQVFFNKEDIVLDPFCGSGTTLVQANELGIHAIGVDISAFNALISNVKISKVDFTELYQETERISKALKKFVANSSHLAFEKELAEFLTDYDKKYFPSPEFKIKVRKKEIDEESYTELHEKIVLKKFYELITKYQIKVKQDKQNTFLEKWYLQTVRNEIDFVFEQIKEVQDLQVKNVLTVILSRTIRSCRATTHADLATLVEPVTTPYYCAKHGKICKPLFSILSWWERYCKDTIQRLAEFSKLRTNTFQYCLNGNSETIDILAELEKKHFDFYELVKQKKIRGIFSSPPYVGLIDYHEQHAYAYDLFGFERKDEQEIGSMSKKQTKQAQQDYVKAIANVLNNCKKFLADDYDVFLVANDKFNLYSQIAEMAGMQIVNQYKRPVLNRTEKDKGAYSEIIFHLKRNSI
ncbi:MULTISPECIES: DNA methyltransferase [Raineya]|jgi:DNA modification methylase|uniref:DNA methylase n=1 Tax=Raineya orbicola TaxID=2016530 RepID=A0A2N3I4X8_9BACT|nr:DNA methyltransferase [Raineya orbicola]PKQ65303.1 DNA methylase [Raineya orbicola]